MNAQKLKSFYNRNFHIAIFFMTPKIVSQWLDETIQNEVQDNIPNGFLNYLSGESPEKSIFDSILDSDTVTIPESIFEDYEIDLDD